MCQQLTADVLTGSDHLDHVPWTDGHGLGYGKRPAVVYTMTCSKLSWIVYWLVSARSLVDVNTKGSKLSKQEDSKWMFSLRKSYLAQPRWATRIGGLDYHMNSITHDIISCILEAVNIQGKKYTTDGPLHREQSVITFSSPSIGAQGSVVDGPGIDSRWCR
jgi:hypothetical protein